MLRARALTRGQQTQPREEMGLGGTGLEEELGFLEQGWVLWLVCSMPLWTQKLSVFLKTQEKRRWGLKSWVLPFTAP